MEIKIEDYLDKSEIKEIVEEELRYKIKEMFKTERETCRILTNLGYYNTFKIIEEEIPDFKQIIKEKTKEQCLNLNRYHIFRSKDSLEREDSLAQKYLLEAVEENKNIIKDRVKEILKEMDKQEIADEICSIIEDSVYNLFKKQKDNMEV